MAYHITQDCLSCEACERECPNGAISPGATTFEIDPSRCTECVGLLNSPRCAELCPNKVPRPDPDHRESYDQLLARFRRLHPGVEPRGYVLVEDSSKPVVLLVADGSADKPGEMMLQKMDSMIRARFPGHDVVWGIQAVYMFPALKARGQYGYFDRRVPLADATEMLSRLAAAGRKKVAMQLLMTSESSFSRHAIMAERHGMEVKYAMPFLTPRESWMATIKTLEPRFGNGIDTATVMVGHGVLKDFGYNDCFVEMDRYLRANYRNAFLATLHGPPGIDGVIEDVKKSSCKRVKFVSLMITGGGHITLDIAGDDPSSWKSRMGVSAEVYTGIADEPIFSNYFIKQIESLLGQFN